jgi:hypothetical protein
MQKILDEVELLNWGALPQVNKKAAFIAPPILQIAKRLLPQAKYEKIKIAPIPKKPLTKLQKLYQGVTQ